MLKKLIVATQLALSLQASAQAPVRAAINLPDNFVRISIEAEPETTSKYQRPRTDDEVRRLKTRVRTLESAVRQLQEEIYYLRYAKPEAPRVVIHEQVVQEKDNRWFCSLTSEFDHTYSGRGDTEIEARSRALSSCQDKERGMFCVEQKVRCELAR